MTTTQTAPWRRTVPNPTCTTWCQLDHAAGEFAVAASLLCNRTVTETEHYRVDV